MKLRKRQISMLKIREERDINRISDCVTRSNIKVDRLLNRN